MTPERIIRAGHHSAIKAPRLIFIRSKEKRQKKLPRMIKPSAGAKNAARIRLDRHSPVSRESSPTPTIKSGQAAEKRQPFSRQKRRIIPEKKMKRPPETSTAEGCLSTPENTMPAPSARRRKDHRGRAVFASPVVWSRRASPISIAYTAQSTRKSSFRFCLPAILSAV